MPRFCFATSLRVSLCLFAIACLADAGVSAAVGAAKQPPNLVIILCDDLGYGDLQCFGHPHIKTPNLDALAKRGARLTSCYSAAPVCSSSRAGMMTGRTPCRLGIFDWINEGNPVHLRPEELTLAEILKAQGYATAHVGKWHLNGKFNSPDQPQPGDHGFDHWMATQNNAAPSHENPVNFVRNGQPVGPLKGFSCQLVADEAIGWLEKRPADRPFYLNVWFHEPHEPVMSPADMVSTYLPVATNENEAQYFANVANMDRAAGRLVAKLDEMKLTDNTLIYFTSDNGPETLKGYKTASRSYGSAGPLRARKLHLYEGGFRVPGIVVWPGRVQSGRVIDDAVCSLDLVPTLASITGYSLPTDREYDGVNVVDLFEGRDFHRDKPLYWQYPRAISTPKVAYRVGDMMLLGHWSGPTLAKGSSIRPGDSEAIKSSQPVDFELYNLKDDLAEAHDLASSDPDTVKRMGDELKKKYAEVIAEAPTWTGDFPGPPAVKKTQAVTKPKVGAE